MKTKIIGLITLIGLLITQIGFSQCRDTLTERFGTGIPTTGGVWLVNSIVYGDSIKCGSTTISCARSKPNYIEFNGIGDFVRTPLIPYQANFSFWYRRSTSTTGHRIIVETSPDNVSWTTIQQITGLTTTYVQSATIAINNVYVRIRDQRDSTTSTRVWYLDDVSWNFENRVGVWKGGVSSDWSNTANWCKGVLPTSTNNVIIPGGTPFKPVISSGVANVNDITLNVGATITNNATLRISGIINSNSQINSLNGTIELAGTTSQNIGGNNFTNKIIGNLRVTNTSGTNIQSDTLKIKNSLTLSANTTLTTNNYLYLLSSDSVTARVSKIPSGARIIGNATVERYCAYNTTWKLIGVPTIGQTINSAFQEGNVPMANTKPGYGTIITSNISNPTSFGFDRYSQNGPSMKYYVQSTGEYQDVGSTSNLINTQTGYFLFVRGDRSVTALGMASTKTILRTRGLLYTPIDNPPPTINVLQDKFCTVNNFYASAIDFSGLSRTGGVQNTYYLWDPQLTAPSVSSYGLGAFQTFVWDGSSYTAVPGGGSYISGNTAIESGSAFYIRSSGSSGTLSFTEDAKVETNNLINRPGKKNPSIRINLSAVVNSKPLLFDAALCQYGRYSNSVDHNDIIKLSSGEGVCILRNDNRLVAEFRNTINKTDTINLNLTKLKKQQYRFNFTIHDMPDIKFMLNDNYLGTSTEFISGWDIPFIVNNDSLSYAPNRFTLVLYKVKNQSKKPTFKILPNPINTNEINLLFSNFDDGRYNLLITSNCGGIILNYAFDYPVNTNLLKVGLPKNMANGMYRVTVLKNMVELFTNVFLKLN